MSARKAALIYVGSNRSPLRRVIERAMPDWLAHHCESNQAALDLVRSPAVRLLACEVSDASGESTEVLLRTVTAKFGTVGTVAIVSRSRADGPALVRLVGAGAHALLLSDDRVTSLECRQVFTEACVRAGVRSTTDGLLGLVQEPARLVLDFALCNAHRAVTVPEMARALHVHRKTLFWWCKEAGIPAPQQLLGWCRLLAAASLLEDRGRKVDHVAFDLDFPSGTALRNLLHRYTGLSPAQLRAAGPVSRVRAEFGDLLGRPDGAWASTAVQRPR